MLPLTADLAPIFWGECPTVPLGNIPLLSSSQSTWCPSSTQQVLWKHTERWVGASSMQSD